MRGLDEGYSELANGLQQSPQPFDNTPGKKVPPSIIAFFDSAESLSDALNELTIATQGGTLTRRTVEDAVPVLKAGLGLAKDADRIELNSVYPELGDAFHGYLVSGVEALILAIETPRSETDFTNAMLMVGDWQSWWSENGQKVFAKLAADYDLETR